MTRSLTGRDVHAEVHEHTGTFRLGTDLTLSDKDETVRIVNMDRFAALLMEKVLTGFPSDGDHEEARDLLNVLIDNDVKRMEAACASSDIARIAAE